MSVIAVLGAGRVASGLALKLASAGHELIIGHRGSATPRWITESIHHRSIADAARDADIIINATPGESSLERLSALRTELAGKILIDVSNAVERGTANMPGTLTYPNSSLAEKLQDALPHTRVIKTLNTMLFTVMTSPDSLRIPATVFLSGNDDAAKATVRQLLGDLGWSDNVILDLGNIHTARGPEAMILFVPDLIRARGLKPFAITVAS